MSARQSFDIHGLPEIGTIRDLSAHADVRPEKLCSLLFGKYQTYRTFRIRKRSGGFRQIAQPIPSLRALQRWLLRNVLDKLNATPSCYGFARGRSGSLRAHAEQHIGSTSVLSLDIRNFFPSISIARV